jgi:hypothetical protein
MTATRKRRLDFSTFVMLLQLFVMFGSLQLIKGISGLFALVLNFSDFFRRLIFILEVTNGFFGRQYQQL